MTRRNWLRLWSGIAGIALAVALILTFIPVGPAITIGGTLSIGVDYPNQSVPTNLKIGDEVVGLRTESSKTYYLGNDTYEARIYGAPTDPNDPWYYSSSSDGDWNAFSTVSYNAIWTSTTETPDTITVLGVGQWYTPGFYVINRAALFFDTSTISAGATITAASLNLYGQADESTTDFLVTVQTGGATYPHDPLANGDFNKAYYSGDLGNFNTSGFTTSGYNVINLNSNGISNITKGGQTKFFLRSDRDIAGTTPTGLERVFVYATESWLGTFHQPYLAVTYTPLPWLTGYVHRVPLYTDYSDVSATLTNFPVLLYVSNSSGINSDDVSCVFDELQSDANRKKIAVTTFDGITQCYVEIEKWDDANEQAWLWVKSNVSSTVNTGFYLYYDSTHADNTAYVGDTNTNVWDSSFKTVHHLKDATTSTVTDSVGLNNGTKLSANNPLEAVGKIGQGQDFSSDYIKKDSPSFVDDTQGTVECLVKFDSTTQVYMPLSVCVSGATDDEFFLFYFRGDSVKEIQPTLLVDGAVTWTAVTPANAIANTNWHHFAITSDATHVKLYVDGAELALTDAVGTNSGQWLAAATQANVFGMGALLRATPAGYLDGMLDEIRYSNDDRTAGWIKATWETERDNLLDWGTEEGGPEITNSQSTWALGYVQVNDVRYFSAGGAQDDDYATVTNTGTCSVNVAIQGLDIEGGAYDWTLASAAGNQTYSLYANSGNGSSTYNTEVKKSSYSNLVAALVVNGTYLWSMKFTAPTIYNPSDDGAQKTTTVTLVATAS
jgi:hypothetical protein